MGKNCSFIREVFFGGITAEENALIEAQKRAYNISVLRTLSLLASAFMVVMFVASLLIDALNDYTMQYLGTFFSSVIIAVMSMTLKPNRLEKMILPLMMLFVATILAFGIVAGYKGAATESSVAFIALLIVAPLMFNMFPLYTAILQVGAIAVFIWAEILDKTPEVFTMDSINAICFGVVGVFLGAFQLRSRLRGLVSTATMEKMSVTDALTGLNNRRAFEEHLSDLEKNIDQINDITLISIDLNGLKNANDSLMHEAGDELLCGAAACIQETFGDRAATYRLGGDEFAVISLEPRTQVTKDIDVLNALVNRWRGKIATNLSMAIGVKSLSEIPSGSLDDLRREADHNMYADKARFYCESGHDRRNR